MGRKHNEIPSGSEPFLACGLHAELSHRRTQAGVGVDPSQARWAKSQIQLSGSSLAAERTELLKQPLSLQVQGWIW